MSDTTRFFCVSSQQAHPKCLPRTKSDVSTFVLECITRSPWSAKSSTNMQITYPFFFPCAFKCALTLECLLISFSKICGSQVSHIVCSSSGTFIYSLTCFVLTRLYHIYMRDYTRSLRTDGENPVVGGGIPRKRVSSDFKQITRSKAIESRYCWCNGRVWVWLSNASASASGFINLQPRVQPSELPTFSVAF